MGFVIIKDFEPKLNFLLLPYIRWNKRHVLIRNQTDKLSSFEFPVWVETLLIFPFNNLCFILS
jgi:hypothetical protein